MSAGGTAQAGGSSAWLAPGATERLRQVVRHAWAHSPAQRARLAAAGLTGGELDSPADLDRIPVLHKADLPALRAGDLPFGSMLGVRTGELQRIFVSPGPVYDPQGAAPDYWRFSPALAAAGFAAGDVVMNCFSYHLSPAGFMFDAAARTLGCVVIPAGVGQQDLQLQVLADTRAQGYIGLPSYLLALLEKAAAAGVQTALRKAFVTAEPLPPALRARLGEYGVAVFQGYGTADLGSIAYECDRREGMHLDAGVLTEICDPVSGEPVPWGEMGEVVCTQLDESYPLLRFGTGDLSALLAEPCPCGHPAPRLRGWLGRAGDGVKVRGMFVYPRQLAEALGRVPGVLRWQAVVDRDEHHRDRLEVQVEPVPGAAVDPAAVAAAVRAATRVNAGVTLGPVPAAAPPLADQRQW